MRMSPRHPRSFTLLEMVVAMAVMSILTAAIGSVILLASRALPGARGPTETTLTASAALDQLVADLRAATGITAAGATAVTFTVPDRTGDGIDDTVSYAWAGAGSPVVRTFNGDAGAQLLASAAAFALGYSKRTVTTNQVTTVQQDT